MIDIAYRPVFFGALAECSCCGVVVSNTTNSQRIHTKWHRRGEPDRPASPPSKPNPGRPEIHRWQP